MSVVRIVGVNLAVVTRKAVNVTDAVTLEVVGAPDGLNFDGDNDGSEVGVVVGVDVVKIGAATTALLTTANNVTDAFNFLELL